MSKLMERYEEINTKVQGLKEQTQMAKVKKEYKEEEIAKKTAELQEKGIVFKNTQELIAMYTSKKEAVEDLLTRGEEVINNINNTN